MTGTLQHNDYVHKKGFQSEVSVMIKTRIVYLCMAILLLLFVVIYAVLPNVGIETKNTKFSYENIVFNKNKVTTIDIEIAEEDWADMLEKCGR
ncbi:hypothetical protein OL548_04315 [Lysinibacillus sp. MHQ-1]|nr:hypothetical protein OL548_04315 [Lysinibacillus sp. MHQ-1]